MLRSFSFTRTTGWRSGVLVTGMLAAMLTSGPAAATPLTLEDCIRRALVHNPDVASAERDRGVASAGVMRARAEFLPTITTSMSVTKPKNEILVNVGDRLEQYDEFWNARASASWPLFDGLGNVAGYRGANASQQAAQRRATQVAQNVAYETERRFYEVRKQEALVAVQRQAEELSAEQLKKTETMRDLGAATQADVLKTEVDHANNRLAALRARRDLQVAEASLATFLGMSIDIALELVPVTEELPTSLDSKQAAAQALEVNPGLVAARESLVARRYGVTAAKAERYPTLALFGNSSFNNFEPKLGVADETTDWNYGLSASLPIFDGLRTKAAINQAQAERIAAERSLKSAEREVLLGVKSAVLDLEIARQSIGVAENAVRSSTEDLRMAQERYRVGEGTILDVIDARVNLTRSETDRVSATYDARLAVSALRNAVGNRVLPAADEGRE